MQVDPERIKEGLQSSDAAALELYLSTRDLWIKAKEEVAEGGLVQRTKSGYETQSAAFLAYVQLTNLLIKLGGDLGLSPAGRSALRHLPQAGNVTLEERLAALVAQD